MFDNHETYRGIKCKNCLYRHCSILGSKHDTCLHNKNYKGKPEKIINITKCDNYLEEVEFEKKRKLRKLIEIIIADMGKEDDDLVNEITDEVYKIYLNEKDKNKIDMNFLDKFVNSYIKK